MSDIKNKRVVIYIDQNAAEDALSRLQAKADGFNTKVKAARDEQQKLNEKIKQAAAAGNDITKLQNRYDELGRKINGYNKDLKASQEAQQKIKQQIDSGISPSFAQLTTYVSRLRNELKNLSQSAPEYANKLAQFQKANTQLKQLGEAMNGVEKSQKSWIDSIKSLSIGVFIANFAQQALSAVTNYIGSIVSLRQEFEKSVNNLSAITGAVGADLEFMKNAAIDFSKTGVKSAKDYIEAMKLIGSAKPELLSHKELLVEVTAATKLLSEASGMELQEAAKALTDALNQYGAGARQAETFVDALAAASKYGAAEVPEVTQALLQFGSQAKSSNIDIYESAAAIELLAEKGIKGAEAGTKLRNVFLALNAVDGLDKKALDSLAQAGVNTEILKDNSLSLQTRLEELGKISNNAASLVAVFGKENFNAGQIVLQNIPRYAELANQVRETGIASQQAKTNTDTWADSWANLKNVVNARFIEGENSFFIWFNRSLASSIEGMGSFVKGLFNIRKSIQDIKMEARIAADKDGDAKYIKNNLANRSYTVDERDSKGNLIRNADGTIRKQTKQYTATELEKQYQSILKLDETSLQEALISKDKERIEMGRERVRQSKLLVDAIKEEAAVEKEREKNKPADAPTKGGGISDEAKRKIESAKREYQQLIKQLTDELNRASKSQFTYAFDKLFEERTAAQAKLTKLFKDGIISKKELEEGIKLTEQELLAKLRKLQADIDTKPESKIKVEVIPEVDEKEVDQFWQQLQRAMSKAQDTSDIIDRDNLAGKRLGVMNASTRKEKLAADLELLEEERKQKILNADKTGNEIAEINAEYDRRITDEKKAALSAAVDEYTNYANQILNIFSTLAQARNNRENQILQADLRRIDERKRKLLESEKFGLVTKQQTQIEINKLDREADEKKRAIEIKQFERNSKIQAAQVLVNSASAAIKLWVSPGPPASIPLSILLAAQTIAQINAINSAKPQFEKGGIAKGARHSDGGINMVDSKSGRKVGEMEGGEPYMILSRNTYKNNKGIVDSLLYTSLYNNGAPIGPQWQTRTYSSIDVSGISKSVGRKRYYEQGGVFMGDGTTSTTSSSQQVIIQSDPELKALLNALLIKLDQPFIGVISQKRIEDANDLRAKIISAASP